MKIKIVNMTDELSLQWSDSNENNPFNYYPDYSFKTAKIAFELAIKRKTWYIYDLKIEINEKLYGVHIYPIAEFLVAVCESIGGNEIYITRLLYNHASIKSICGACGLAYEYYNALKDKKDGFCCQPARLATLKERNKNSHSTPRRLYMSVPKVADEIGIAYQTLCLYENQEVKPRMKKIQSLAEVYKCDVEDLFKNDEISYKSLKFLKYVGAEEYCGINIEEELKRRQNAEKEINDYYKILCYYA